MFVDTHSHLFYPNYSEDLKEVIDRAIEKGVKSIIVPATNLISSLQAIELADKYDSVYATIGIHPHDTKEWDESFIPKLEELLQHKKVVAIGEIGLDYYYDFSPKDKQISALQAQIELALKYSLPVVVHNRESDADLLEILLMYKDSGLRGQLHCFSGSSQMAKQVIEMGHYVSFTGNITFSKFDDLREVAKSIGCDKLLLETDSPFMTPVPYRGKRNEPAYVELVANKLAEIHNKSIKEIAEITTENAFRLFGVGVNRDLILTYRLGNSLYINVTNRCNADCVFCDHKGEATIGPYKLKMEKSEEPPAHLYIKEIGDPKEYDEIVFCGYGEPTIRWEIVKQISKYVKEFGGKTRLNTNGHGNVINHKNITSEMRGLIDTVSISLNTTLPEKYGEIMRLPSKMFFEMIEFAKKSKNEGVNVIMSVVDMEDINIESAKDFVINDVGVNFRVRNYF